MKKLDVCVADTSTGEVRPLIEERLNTYIESRPLRLVNNGQDLLHWSERDGWGHYYLYDANTGALKNRLTEGEFVSMSVDGWDDKTKTLFFTAVGREKGEDPYYPHLYRVGYDGSGLKLLNPGNASHAAHDCRQRALLRRQLVARRRGARVGAARHAWEHRHEAGDAGPERAQRGGLQVPRALRREGRRRRDRPVRRHVQAVRLRPEEEVPDHRLRLSRSADRERDEDVQPARQQHVARAVRVHRHRGGQPRRQPVSARSGTTTTATATCATTGSPTRRRRSSSSRTRHAYVDLNRVGIWGHSGGGFMSAAAMLVYPDFFKVAWSESGNHENNIYNNTWSEKNHGIKEVEKDGKVTFEFEHREELRAGQEPEGTPDARHGGHRQQRPPGQHLSPRRRADQGEQAVRLHDPAGRAAFASRRSSGYVNQRRADYFCRYLLGNTQEERDIVELNREQQQTGEAREDGSQFPTPQLPTPN